MTPRPLPPTHPADPYRNLGPATVVRGDALALPIADDSVDLIVTSPPYFGLRSYTDAGAHYDRQLGAEATPGEYIDALLAATREAMRVLKPTGSLWVNLGDKYAVRWASERDEGRRGYGSRDGTVAGRRRSGPNATGVREKSLIGLPWRYALACIDDLGLILRAEVIWSKPNGLPESVVDRVRRSHETWFHFTLEPRYYSAVDNVRDPYHPDTAGRYAGGYAHSKTAAARQSVNADYSGAIYDVNPLGKLPGSVREVPTAPLDVPAWLGVDHFAAFPPAWPAWLIRGWAPAGATILDPFGGTGTTALAARALGAHGITVDYSADYCRVARWRTGDLDQLAAIQGHKRAARGPADAPDTTLLDLL